MRSLLKSRLFAWPLVFLLMQESVLASPPRLDEMRAIQPPAALMQVAHAHVAAPDRACERPGEKCLRPGCDVLASCASVLPSAAAMRLAGLAACAEPPSALQPARSLHVPEPPSRPPLTVRA